LIKVPGFSFFRAPARWSVATALALALLAGRGFDRWPEWRRAGRSMSRLAVAAIIWVAATLLLIELALLSTGKPPWPLVARGFQRIFAALPWPGEPSFNAVLAQARKPLPDPRVPPGLSQTIMLKRSSYDRVFTEQRASIYARELREAAVLVLLLLFLARISEKEWLAKGRVQGALLVLTLLELWVLSRHRLIDVAPWKSLAAQSPVLARLAREPRGTRVADRRLRNLPMSAGLAPISAYRTLDLPAAGSLTSLALEPFVDPRNESLVRSALRATGTGVRVFDPVENRLAQMFGKTIGDRETIEDPALATWLFDAAWVAEQGAWARTFSIWRPEEAPARAWLVRESDVTGADILGDWSGKPVDILRVIDKAMPLPTESVKPEEWSIWIEASERGWVVVSQLADPQWKARWNNLDRPWVSDAEIKPAFRRANEAGGWQCIEVPEAGRWMLHLEYESPAAAAGMGVSVIAWTGWIVAMLRTGFLCWRKRSVPRQNEMEP